LTTGRKYHLLTTFTWLDFIDVAKGINVISLIMILKKKKKSIGKKRVEIKDIGKENGHTFNGLRYKVKKKAR